METTPSTLNKSDIADLYATDLRTIHRALEAVKAKYPYWFTRKKQLFPTQYKPILAYLEKEQGFERSMALSRFAKAR